MKSEDHPRIPKVDESLSLAVLLASNGWTVRTALVSDDKETGEVVASTELTPGYPESVVYLSISIRDDEWVIRYFGLGEAIVEGVEPNSVAHTHCAGAALIERREEPRPAEERNLQAFIEKQLRLLQHLEE